MKKHHLDGDRTLLFLILLLSSTPAGAGSDATDATPSGREIMARVEERPRGADQRARAVWRLVAGSGRERLRETRILRRDPGPDGPVRRKWLVVFDAPPDVRDVALLVWSGRGAGDEDHRWLYLASLRKVKRVAAGSGDQTFMGSDFSYDDLTERALDEDTHQLLRSEAVDGGIRHVVESVPVASSPYSKRVQWVDPASWTVSRVELYAGERLEKTLETRWQELGGIWTATRLEMNDLRTGHRTVVEIDDVEYDSGLPDDLFDPQSLPSGAR